MTNPYTDLTRPPLHASALRRRLVVPGGLWREIRVVEHTGSTNADVVEAARAGAAEGLVIVAESQSAGRGRLGRQWTSPPRAGIAASVLLRPTGVAPARYGWLPLLAGVALAEAVRRTARVDAVLKWPNDLLIGDRKCGGILVEMHVGAAVIGFGVNATLREDELPVPTATSLALAGAAATDREPLLRAILRSLADWYGRWRESGGDAVASDLRTAYLFHCMTPGREVLLELPGGRSVRGPATDIDPDGSLVVDGRPFQAGDVVHLR